MICLKSMNEGVKVFNTKLKHLYEELRSQMNKSTIVYVDMYSIKYDLIANSSSYGKFLCKTISSMRRDSLV